MPELIPARRVVELILEDARKPFDNAQCRLAFDQLALAEDCIPVTTAPARCCDNKRGGPYSTRAKIPTCGALLLDGVLNALGSLKPDGVLTWYGSLS
jgi:hypothetical protein